MASRLALTALLLAALFPQAASVEPRPPRGPHTLAVVRGSVALRSRPTRRANSRTPRLRRMAYSLHADLSERSLELRRGGRTVRRLTVAVGRPGSETPTGRFAVTDKLRGSRYGPYYGCCILALNGHQPHLPAGWPGGDRLAIHGTDSPGTIGTAASAGCLRAADADLELLMRRVPRGTPVFIRD
jgi:lipoprotein-anchoring transpeptidase ErfK/SrfK